MIYFDHNATTPMIPEVKEVMVEAMENFWGNPSSAHMAGQKAFAELEKARERFATLLSVNANEIIFTSGGTEADNIAIIGTMGGSAASSLIISAIEHPAVKVASQDLERKGIECRVVPVKENGQINLETLKERIDGSTKLISVMLANNEIGTIQPVKVIGEIAEEKSILFHSDAVQAFGKVPLNIQENKFSLLSFSSHKLYGPKGCGALYVKKGVQVSPRTFGGSQEKKIRTGTQNLPAILGFVKAAEIAYEKMEEEKNHLVELTEFLFQEISKNVPNIVRNGDSQQRLPGTLNVSFPGTTSEIVVPGLDREGICVSGGAACASGATEPSATIMAIGRRKIEGISAIRFSLGRSSTKEEIIKVVKVLKGIVERIRGVNS